MLKKMVMALALILLFTGGIFAQELLSFEQITGFLDREQKETLIKDGELTQFHFDDFDPMLLPDTALTSRIRETVASMDLNMGIEGLFLDRDFDIEAYKADPEAVLLTLYNVFRGVSTLEGTQYYSASRGEMRDLFVESWQIPSPGRAEEKMADPLVEKIPLEESIFIHQKDKSFSKHESKMTFVYEAPMIWALTVNESSMYYKGFIRVMKPHHMQIDLLVIPTDKGLLFYGISAADTLKIKSFREKANKSFYNRVKALYAWYTAQRSS